MSCSVELDDTSFITMNRVFVFEGIPHNPQLKQVILVDHAFICIFMRSFFYFIFFKIFIFIRNK